MSRALETGRFAKHVAIVAGGMVLGVGLVACAGPDWVPPPGSIPDPPPAPVVVAPHAVSPAPVAFVRTPDRAETEILEQDRHHHHGGVTMFIAMALDTLAVAPAERTQVAKIQGMLADDMAAAQDAERHVLGTLADGVQAGVLDPAKVNASIARLARASGAIHAGTVAPLAKLHSILSPLERATLSDKVQAHWAVWRRVNGVGATGSDARVAALTDVLGLSADEVAKIRTAVSAIPAGAALDTKDVGAHIRAFAAAFAADAFDKKTIGAADDARLATVGATFMAHFCEAATPLLTPEQRTKLAAHLREHLDHSDTPAGT
jgi:Spy/CpxP family protein refolding chaperone